MIRSGLHNRAAFLESYDVVVLALFATLAIGLAYMLLVQLCPNLVHYAAILLGGAAAIAFGALLVLQKSPHHDNLRVLRYVFAGIFGLVGLFALLMILMYRRYLRVSAVFLKYATAFVAQTPSVVIYILLLLLFTTGLAALTVFELLAIWGATTPAFESDRIFHISQGKYAITLTVLVFIQLYWGLAFLKELCNKSLIQLTSVSLVTLSTGTSTAPRPAGHRS